MDEPDKIRLYSLSFDSATGALSTEQDAQKNERKAKKDDVAYATPLCTSRDQDHVFVVYPVDNVGIVISLFSTVVCFGIAVTLCYQTRRHFTRLDHLCVRFCFICLSLVALPLLCRPFVLR